MDLEQRLELLVDRFHELERIRREQGEELQRCNATIRELEAQNAGLRAQIDNLGKDRFSLKQLRDERKVIRRKVTTALNRLETLEQQL